MGKASEQILINGTTEWNAAMDELFPIIEASKLSEKDEFLQYKPKTIRQDEFRKTFLLTVIDAGQMQDFRKPIMDPSVDENGNIIFAKREKPALGYDMVWWDDKAKSLYPTKNSRLGNKREYYAFLGCLIKTLIEEGFKVEDAWRAVCDNSAFVGHYLDSPLGICRYEPTGSRKVGKWYDLANTQKIIKVGAYFYAIVSGSYNVEGSFAPLASSGYVGKEKKTSSNTVGWIVMDV